MKKIILFKVFIFTSLGAMENSFPVNINFYNLTDSNIYGQYFYMNINPSFTSTPFATIAPYSTSTVVVNNNSHNVFLGLFFSLNNVSCIGESLKCGSVNSECLGTFLVDDIVNIYNQTSSFGSSTSITSLDLDIGFSSSVTKNLLVYIKYTLNYNTNVGWTAGTPTTKTNYYNYTFVNPCGLQDTQGNPTCGLAYFTALNSAGANAFKTVWPCE